MTLLSTKHNEAAAECIAKIGSAHIPSLEEKIRASETFRKDVLVAAHMEALHDAYILEMGSYKERQRQQQHDTMLNLKVEVSSPTSAQHVTLSSLKPSTLRQLKVGKVHRRRVVHGTLCVNTLCTKIGPSGSGQFPISVNVLEDEEGNATPIYIVSDSMILENGLRNYVGSSSQAQLLFPMGSKVAIKEPYLTRLPNGEVVLSVENSADLVFLWVPHRPPSVELDMGTQTDEGEMEGSLVVANVGLDVVNHEDASKDEGLGAMDHENKSENEGRGVVDHKETSNDIGLDVVHREERSNGMGLGVVDHEKTSNDIGLDELHHEERSNDIGLDVVDHEERANGRGLDVVDHAETSNDMGLDVVDHVETSNDIGLDVVHREERSNDMGLGVVDPEKTSNDIGLDEVHHEERSNDIGLAVVDHEERANDIGLDVVDHAKTSNDMGLDVVDHVETSNDIGLDDHEERSNDIGLDSVDHEETSNDMGLDVVEPSNDMGLDVVDHVETSNDIGLDVVDHHVETSNDIGLDVVDHVERSNDIGLDVVDHVETSNDIGLDVVDHVERSNGIGLDVVDHVETSNDIGLDVVDHVDRSNDIGLDVVDHVETSNDIRLDVVDHEETSNDIGLDVVDHEETSNDIGLDVVDHEETSNDIGLDVVDHEETSNDIGLDVVDHEETSNNKGLDVVDQEETSNDIGLDVVDQEGTSKAKDLDHGSIGVVNNMEENVLDHEEKTREVQGLGQSRSPDEVENFVKCGIGNVQAISVEKEIGDIDEVNTVGNASRYVADFHANDPVNADKYYGSKCKEEENDVDANEAKKLEHSTSGESEGVMMISNGFQEKDRIDRGDDGSVELRGVEVEDVNGDGVEDVQVFDQVLINGANGRDGDGQAEDEAKVYDSAIANGVPMLYTPSNERMLMKREDEIDTHGNDPSILRAKGNELFTRGEISKAGEMYTMALKAVSTIAKTSNGRDGDFNNDGNSKMFKMKEEEVLSLSNRAEVWLRLGAHGKAIEDADAAMASIHLLQELDRSDQQHSNVAMAKALFRKGRALMGLGRYHEALVLLHHLQHLSKDPHLFQAMATCKSRLARRGMNKRGSGPAKNLRRAGSS